MVREFLPSLGLWFWVTTSTMADSSTGKILSACPRSTPRYCGAAVPAAWAGETPVPQLIPGQALTQTFCDAVLQNIDRLASSQFVL